MNEDGNRPAESVRDTAIEWWVSCKAGLSQVEQAAFEAWLAADPAHAAAFADISQTFEHAKRVRQSRRASQPAFVSRKGWLYGPAFLAAASLALYLFFGPLSTVLQSDYSTGTGEIKSLTLADGSHVALDARSAIAVHFAAHQRQLTLLEGEVWFEATPDLRRPFTVEAAGGTVTALGTAFGIELNNAGARVSVAEHQVRVASGGENVVVSENQQTAFKAHSPPGPPTPAGPDSIAAWRRGKLIVEDRPLGEVLSVLGRYRHGFVYCLSAAICARNVTGVFSTNNPLRALREIEVFLGLHAVHLTNYLIVLYE
jgi:transmembrane sensor